MIRCCCGQTVCTCNQIGHYGAHTNESIPASVQRFEPTLEFKVLGLSPEQILKLKNYYEANTGKKAEDL